MAHLLNGTPNPRGWNGPLTHKLGINIEDLIREDRDKRAQSVRPYGADPGFDGCLCCGRKLAADKGIQVYCHGGSHDVIVPLEGDPDYFEAIENEPGHMGVYNVGPTCGKRIAKAVKALGLDPSLYTRAHKARD